ncbi:hypothetical protein CA13_41500 [Planctomycetes bacterium CA13]|uniref:DUF5722 domain-containing protein n=1 Tax=Novipirellula herctigrandis TaxID=2527986 RepID=A0A5C5Z6G8_9BACT|nr:hypothetical protein CA13_41500 [Planctomycetes bacterium CA13]
MRRLLLSVFCFIAAVSSPQLAEAQTSAAKERLLHYLDQPFACQLTKVSVSSDLVHIEGCVPSGKDAVWIADIPIDVVLGSPEAWNTRLKIEPNTDGQFAIDVPRYRKRHGLNYDRLTSRWQLVQESTDGITPLSSARYPLSVVCRSPNLPPANPKNKKGLGGWHTGRLPNEIDDLGISAVTVNVMIHTLVQLEPGKDTFPIQWQGRTYHAKKNALERLDNGFIEAQKHGLMVSVIVLVANPAKAPSPVVKLLGHPDATKDGIFAMPNVTSAEGIGIFGAILNLMAERWSRPDGMYGRVHHWIMHNEVDAGWEWTNAGEKSSESYLDLYQRSMRLMDLIARQYDPNTRPFISLTHHWAWHGAEHWYGSKRLIDLLVRFCKVEGDFPWAVAYHPYPQSLLKPRTWEDSDATYTFETKKITPKNLEVLDAYMKQKKLRFEGSLRPVHLSENGFNSPDYSEKSLEDQAAGMALAWNKIQPLESIKMWHYHNWIDNHGEGELRIGLRKYPDDKDDPFGKKPIWYLYQSLGTAKEQEVAHPYLKTIKIESWKQVIHDGEIR